MMKLDHYHVGGSGWIRLAVHLLVVSSHERIQVLRLYLLHEAFHLPVIVPIVRFFSRLGLPTVLPEEDAQVLPKFLPRLLTRRRYCLCDTSPEGEPIPARDFPVAPDDLDKVGLAFHEMTTMWAVVGVPDRGHP